jgi:hypothetical protein
VQTVESHRYQYSIPRALFLLAYPGMQSEIKSKQSFVSILGQNSLDRYFEKKTGLGEGGGGGGDFYFAAHLLCCRQVSPYFLFNNV